MPRRGASADATRVTQAPEPRRAAPVESRPPLEGEAGSSSRPHPNGPVKPKPPKAKPAGPQPANVADVLAGAADEVTGEPGPQASADVEAPRANREVPRANRPGGPSRRPRASRGSTPEERLTMTDEMEPIDDSTMVRRKIDHTLARFSAAHDELAAEEAKRKQRMEKLAARPAQFFEQTRTRLQRVVAPKGEAQPETETSAEAGSDEQAEPQDRLQETKKGPSERTARIGRVSLIALAVVVFLGVGALWGTKTWFNSKFTEIAALDENSADIQNAPAQLGDENFLIAGSDTRAGATAGENVGSADDVEGARSDTVMLAHIPADRKRAVVISFPRDLEITRPDCNTFDAGANTYGDKVVPGESKAKLNTAYAIGGPRCLTKWVQQLTGLKINHFVGIDFGGFKDMVDAVQGVTVHIDQPIKDSVLGMVISQTGDVTISGDQALSFVRARHVIGDPTSDYGRIKRQQQFIGSLLTKVMSHGVLTNPSQLSGFVTAFAKATFGDNIGVDQLLTLAQSLQGLDPSKVSFMTVPTTGEANSRGNEVLLDTKAKELFQALINNGPLPGTAPAPPASANQASPPSAAGKNSAEQ